MTDDRGRGAWAIARLLFGDDPDHLHLEALQGQWQKIARLLIGAEDRHTAFEKWAARQNASGKAMIGAVFAVGPDDPNPLKGSQALKTRWTVGELLVTTFPEPKWAVPDIMPVGLAFLAGRPKIGKSWLALQVAHAVGTGGRVLDRDVEKGKVLYLSFEDSPRRLKSRILAQDVPSTADITFATEWPTFDAGGMVKLQQEIAGQDYSLAVIDTLSRFVGNANQLDLAEMTSLLGGLQKIAQLEDLTTLIVDHHTKPSGFNGNPIDDIIGSTAKAAVLDVAIGLYREQGKRSATLKVVGRDVEEKGFAIEWDGLAYRWQMLGEAGKIRKDSAKAEILEAIRTLVNLGELPTTTKIARLLGKDKGNVSRDLADMVSSGEVIKGEKVGREVPYHPPDITPGEGVQQ